MVFRLLISCRSTEHDHVKDNLPAKLLRIRTFGKMKLEEFKDLISPQDYKTCEAKMIKNPTWYPLTLDIFVKFLYKVIHPPLQFALRAHKHVFILAEDNDTYRLITFSVFISLIHSHFSLCAVERVVQRSGHCSKVVSGEYT